jgi:hypothetical protein
MRGAPSPAGGHVLLVARGPIAFLAADRGRVALSVVYGASPKVAVWNPARRSIVRFPTDLRDDMHVWPEGLALIGDTVAWLGAVETGAHETPMVLMQARLDRPSSPDVAAFAWSPDGGSGNFLGDLHNDGSQVAFDTYYVCGSDAQLDPQCQPGFGVYDVATEQVYALNVGQSGTCASIPSGADPYDDITFPPDPTIRCRQLLQTTGAATVLAVGGGRIAIGRPDGSIELLDASGAPQATVSSNEGTVKAISLDGTKVVLLARATPWRAVLEVQNASTGALEHSVTLARTYAPMGGESDCTTTYRCPSLRLESAAKDVVVYALSRTLHLLRLTDDRDVTVTRSFHAYALHAQLDQSGLFYSYDVHDHGYPGRVVHLTWNALARVLDDHHHH